MKACLVLILCMLALPLQASNLTIRGISGEVLDNIKLLVASQASDCLEPANNLEKYRLDLEKTITKATQPFGFYSPSLTLEVKDSNQTCLQLDANIKLNQAIKVELVDISLNGSGKSDKNFVAAIERFPLKVGDILVDKHYSQLKRRLESIAIEHAYLDFEFSKAEILISRQDHSAKINLHINTGQRYRLGEVEVVQEPQFLDQSFVEALVPLKAEQWFTNSDLFKARNKILDSNYFASASVSLQRDSAKNGKVPVKIILTKQNRIDYSVGVGFSTDTKTRFRFDYNNRQLNDKGYQFSSKLSLSDVVKELTAGLKLPSQSNPANSWYSLDLGFKEELTDITQSKSSKFGISKTRVLPSGWKTTNFIDLVYDEFDTGIDEGSSFLVVPGTSWNYISTDNPVLPDQGFRFQTEIQGAHEQLASDATFLQVSAAYKGISTFAPKHRLIYRAEVGTSLTSDLTDLPLDYRFFAGGDNSVRGVDYRTISPQDDTGDFIGGKHLAVASIEYDYRFAESWAFAVFSDIGSAFNDSPDFQKSLGIGLRWISPIGPIRLDLAAPIDSDQDQIRLHLSLGPDL